MEEFQQYWLQEHTRVIKRLPAIRCYVQNHPLPENYTHGEPLYDGVAELWGDDIHTFRNMAADPLYTDVLADEKVFLDRDSTALVMTSEQIINNGPNPPDAIKLLELYRRKPGMTVEEFQHYWRHVHGPLVNGLARLRRYVQSPARPGGYTADRAPAYDAMSSMWFDSMDDLVQVMKSDRYADIIKDQNNFININEKLSMTCREYVLVGGH